MFKIDFFLNKNPLADSKGNAKETYQKYLNICKAIGIGILSLGEPWRAQKKQLCKLLEY